ncbi:fasciclin [Arthrobacter sp. RIT-PI-e]|uniref:fasciclin domain-containing protein n=1 Tax=Arthrobacter sp. RIT-PI-e TaxID=1681197 RepID=UPI000675DDE4|nr:fasciclin domain-containing protein [Arthrobacter sp. RIT-PI-e]KNC19229.1 fasciclin [Arthrobacter sp. RIT-PI-e]
MGITKRRNLSILGIAAVSMLGLAACGGGDDEPEMATQGGPSQDASEAPMESESASPEASMESSMEASETPMAGEDMDVMANLVGAGCGDYAAQVPDGDGSVEGMSLLPVTEAAGANPLLTQLTAAVSGQLNPDVNLVDTLNSGEFTVFAPVDSAFEALDAATLETLQTDADTLSSILTYHVVAGKIQPTELEGTMQETVQGGEVEITGSGDELMVNDANVICGGVQTSNAVVYLIDGVLTPPAE